MTEILESIAVSLAFGEGEMKCPFSHEPVKHTQNNKIPPDHGNSSGTLGRALKAESHHVKTLGLNPPFAISTGGTCAKAGFSPHHLIPGNEMWNNKGQPLHAWIHAKVENKVKGDIGYINNAKYNGLDLPSHHMFAGWAVAAADQPGYAFAAMTADPKTRQFHDAHKAYSDMAWKALEKIAAKLDNMVEMKGCGKKHCPAERSKPFDPPYGVLPQLRAVASRLKAKLWGSPDGWQPPIITSRFALLYKEGGRDQEEARKELSRFRDQMGRPTG